MVANGEHEKISIGRVLVSVSTPQLHLPRLLDPLFRHQASARFHVRSPRARPLHRVGRTRAPVQLAGVRGCACLGDYASVRGQTKRGSAVEKMKGESPAQE